ncbi:mitochondrial deoxynucleotide carrier [Ophiostoma piceae UAMH 11346]|uniref:Mitochondrial thiamine pyrophosphate carrier 1 n=1 Tax=Ophiostoma piceae (strain UAMH 11346) TaxID=1262450 RepID=S3C0L9_OPHP1|nr:mitochondrial deoxynucleotide carrier [Ophiostoma piceae UAMH 11346]
MSGKTERLQDEVVIAGGTAGLIARFFVAPLDVVKIRLQLQTHSLSDPLSQRNINGGPIYKGTLRTMRHIVRHEGITGLWKGNVPAELLYVCYSATQFTAYRAATVSLAQIHDALGIPATPPLDSFVAGASAGAAATAATYPLDLLRTRFAAQGNDADRVYTSLRGAVRDIARDEGATGFFRGLGPALIQIAPYMGAFFTFYEGLKPITNRIQNDVFRSGKSELLGGNGLGTADAAAGIMAAVMAKTFVFPLDLVRKRIQVQGPTRSRYVHKNIPVYDRGVARALATILRTEGVRGLYRGLIVSLFKAAPANAITMWTYERVLHVLTHMDAEAVV